MTREDLIKGVELLKQKWINPHPIFTISKIQLEIMIKEGEIVDTENQTVNGVPYILRPEGFYDRHNPDV
jgi:hypothetical protein